MIVVGGTYSEICFEPIWEQIYGSGFRAVSLLMQLDSRQEIQFFTFADGEVQEYLEYSAGLSKNLSLNIHHILKSPEFRYDYPLRTPSIFPRADNYSGSAGTLSATGPEILVYGLLEGGFLVNGQKVVYDPQSPANPKTFGSTGSKAEELVVVINSSEARKLAKAHDIDSIRAFFFMEERCRALILKQGARGALVFESISDEGKKVPVYETANVWPIGSGDVFSASFAYHWFKGDDLFSSAVNASKTTALYCNSMDLSVNEGLGNFKFPELSHDTSIKDSQIYLAGPFFTFSQRWLINEAWVQLKAHGLKVFSPFHDVGHGNAHDVVDKDLEGLKASQAVFAIIDGLDSGTLFEVGYAIAEKKKVVAFVQNENEESLKMLQGTNCILEKDFTTAIYKTHWALAKR